MKNGEQKIPMIPGMVFDKTIGETKKKQQNFQIAQGTMIEKNQQVLGEITMNNIRNLYLPMKTSQQIQNEKIEQKFQQSQGQQDIFNQSILANTTQILNGNFDEKVMRLKVLRFYGYFIEKMIQNPKEKFTHRNIVLYYYLEDNTIAINEPQIQNSGMMQGKQLSRQRVPIDLNFKEFLSFNDFRIGQNIEIFKIKYYLYDCDACTRRWFELQGQEQPQSIQPNQDNFTILQNSQNLKLNDPLIKEHKHYCEVALGGGNSNNGLAQYLQNDGKVLSFDAIWHDQTFGGGINKYKMNFNLADDKIEVKELHTPNNGKSPFPLLLKKQKLSKKFQMSYCPGMLKENEHIYKAQDLILGQYINVYNREFLLIDCDEFTRNYYQEDMGIDQVKIPFDQQQKKNWKQPEIPPHNGFGSEIDSLGNCYNLIPKPPRVDMAKKFIYNRVILRFVCRKISKQTEDLYKRFLLSFYCGDDSMMLYLQTNRNSGILNGKYMEKKRYKNEETGEYFKMSDIYMGVILKVNKQEFQIIQGDDYTLNFMFQKPDLFPNCDQQKLFKQIKEKISNQYENFEQFLDNFRQRTEEQRLDFVDIYEIIAHIKNYL